MDIKFKLSVRDSREDEMMPSMNMDVVEMEAADENDIDLVESYEIKNSNNMKMITEFVVSYMEKVNQVLEDYDELFVEKLDLLLKIMKDEQITWKGRFRPALQNQSIYPRPVQQPAPVWLGVGGTPESFVRAGSLGLPLMVAIIGGETHHFKPLVDLYREAGKRAGYSAEQLKVGMH